MNNFVKFQYERVAKIQRILGLQRQFGDFLKEHGQEREYQHTFVECYLSGLLADNLLKGTFSSSDFEDNRSNLISTFPIFWKQNYGAWKKNPRMRKKKDLNIQHL